MSHYTEESMGAIVHATGTMLGDKIFWHTCKIAVLTWTYSFLEGYRLSVPRCPFQAQTSAYVPLRPASVILGAHFPHPSLPLSFRLQNCNLTSASCETLRSVLSAQPSLTELHVGDNKLGTAGVKVLCQGMMNPNCKLQKLQ